MYLTSLRSKAAKKSYLRTHTRENSNPYAYSTIYTKPVLFMTKLLRWQTK